MTSSLPSSDARDAILDAAELLFARQGFAQTTIKQIGADAGVNSALLYYYFADKEALYREVLGRLLMGLAAEGLQRVRAASDPASAIRALVEGQVEMLLSRPRLPPLLIREMLDHQAVHAQRLIADHMAGLFAAVCDVIRAGQRSGAFRPEPDPRYAAISTIAQVVYVFLARPALGAMMGGSQGTLPDDEMRAFGRHAADFALAALTFDGGSVRPARTGENT